MRQLEIKVCGNTEGLNLAKVCKLQPDYVGFIFYHKSKRFVKNPTFVSKVEGCKAKRVGVFVNANLDYIQRKTNEFALDIIQLHGDETPDFCQNVSKIKPVIKAFQINNNFNFNVLNNYKSNSCKFLFDTSSKSYGGSGKKFNWSLLERYNLNKPFFLSGGISENDAEEIKKINNPMLLGIDVNSRFETEPGIKNIEMLSKFINKIRT